MKLLFKQRFFSWFDSYDIYAEDGSTYFTVKGKLAWGHRFIILDKNGDQVGEVKEEVLHWLPHFRMYDRGRDFGYIKREFTWLKPKFTLACDGWEVNGNWYEWNYQITKNGNVIAKIDKKIWNWTDTYEIDINNDEDALRAVMVVLAIDAVKCNQGNY